MQCVPSLPLPPWRHAPSYVLMTRHATLNCSCWWVGVTEAGLNPSSSAPRLGKANFNVHLRKLVCTFITGIRVIHSPWLSYLGHCLQLGRQRLYPLLTVSEVKVFSQTHIQEHKPATKCFTTCLSCVKAIFSTNASQHKPAPVKQHELNNSWRWDPCGGQSPSEWLTL